MIRKTESVDYEFKQTDVDSFELLVTAQPKGSTMTMVINQAHKAWKMKTGGRLQEGRVEELLNKHILPSQYNNLVCTMFKPILKLVYAELGKDGVAVLREQVKEVKYYKKENIWFLDVSFTGTMHKD